MNIIAVVRELIALYRVFKTYQADAAKAEIEKKNAQVNSAVDSASVAKTSDEAFNAQEQINNNRI